MKQQLLASTLGFALVASAAWIPSQKAGAVSFSSPPDSSTLGRTAPGASRTMFKSGTATGRDAPGASRTMFKSGTVPGRTVGGSSRNGASGAQRDGRRYLNYPHNTVEQPAAILALLPQSYSGTTVSQRAQILIYVPQSAARDSVFSFKDARGNTVYETNVPISGKAEIISIKVPTELQIDKDYKWFLALKVDGELSTRTPYVDGWIKRIRPNQEITASMQQPDLLQQAEVLAKHGVWYDCVAALAKLRASQPNNPNLNKEWSELLESVGLQQIDKAPVVAFNQF